MNKSNESYKMVVYEHTDPWGNYTIEYYDEDGYLILETHNADGSSSYRCLGSD